MKLNRIRNKKIKNIIISLVTATIMFVNIILISSVFGNDAPLNLLDKWLISDNLSEENNQENISLEKEYANVYESVSKEANTDLASSSESGVGDIFDLAKLASSSLKNNEMEEVKETDTATDTLSASTDIIITADSIIQGVRDNKFESTKTYTLKVNNVEYPIEVLEFTGDVTYSSNATLGDSTGSTTADERMLVLKYHKNLTIDSGVTLTPQVRKKGMFIYVGGKLVNNGTITMTARGSSATGQDVYLWKNSNNSYETVPAVGGAGLEAFTISTTASTYCDNGNDGSTVSNRATGGGGRGATRNGINNKGEGLKTKIGMTSAGTSYAGGSGSAGARIRDAVSNKSNDASVSYGNGPQGGNRL